MAQRRWAELTDMELADHAGRGDGDAFAEIVRRHDHRLRGFVRRLLPFGQGTDDVMQEVYLRAFRALPRFRGDASLKTWLYRIASNASVDHLRRRRVVEVHGDDWPEPVWPGSDPADVASTGDVVTRALALLSPRHRAVALLIDCDGLNYEQAAAVLQVTTGTVKSQLSRARSHLRQAISAATPDAA